MSSPTPEPTAESLAARAAPALVRLRSATGSAVGVLLSADGHLATCLHALIGAQDLVVVLADGREVRTLEVLGTDARRDLAMLRVHAPDLDWLPLASGAGLASGERVVAVGVGGATDTEVTALRPLGAGLELAELADLVDETEAGAPLINTHGEVAGLVLAAQRDDEPVTLGIPASCLGPYLALREGKPLSELRRSGGIRRAVPEHPLSLLDGAAADGLEKVLGSIGAAIQSGAPAYNAGDIAGCYRRYRQTAERLLLQRGDCPGAQRALREGLARAESLGDVDEQAWALRDCFDGLIAVIERWFEAQTGMSGPTPAGKKTYLN